MRGLARQGVYVSCAAAGAFFCACSLLIDVGALTEGGGKADAGALDAGSDSPTDARPDALTDAGTWCEQQPPHTFCADFDQNPIGFGWTHVDTDPVDGVTLDRAALSAPFSARAYLQADAGNCQYVQLSKQFSDLSREAHLAFSFRPGQADGGGSTSSHLVAFLKAGNCGYIFNTSPKSSEILVQYTGSTDAIVLPGGQVPLGSWAQFRLDVDLKMVKPTMKFSMVTVNGPVQLAAQDLPATCGGDAKLQFTLGAYCQNQETEVRFDNVTFDAK